MANQRNKVVGLIGVGKMGLRMTLRLLERGYKVIVTDISLNPLSNLLFQSMQKLKAKQKSGSLIR